MIISAEGIILRPFCESDINQLYMFRNDPNVVGMLGGFSFGYSKSDLKDWIELHRQQDNEILWCIADQTTDDCLGHIGLYNIDFRVRKAELALIIGQDSRRGKGLGKMVSSLAIDYAFLQLNIRRVELSLLSRNLVARKLYDSLGFVEEGIQKEAQFRKGAYLDVTMMALMNPNAI